MNLERIGWGMVVIGAAALLAAPFVILRIVEAESLKADARLGGPPPAVAIEDFDPARHVGLGAETTILGQVDPLDFVIEPAPGVRWIAPVYATDAGADPAADPDAARPLGWIAHGATPWSPDLLVDAAREDGPIAFILEINGRLIDPRRLAPAFELLAAPWGPETIVLEPFLDGRDVALAEAPRWRFRAAMWAIGPLGLVLAGWGWARGSRRPPRKH